MATRTWSGATGLFTDASQWSDNTVPGQGDVAVINSGSVNALSLGFTGITINLNATGSSAGTLTLNGDTLDPSSVLTINDSNAFGSSLQPALLLQGTDTNNGTINFTGTTATVQFAAGATLVNAGNIFITGASPQVQISPGASPGAVTNNGNIYVANPSGAFQSMIVNATISGNGNINLSKSGALSLRQSVSSGQTVAFTGGLDANTRLEIDSPNAFNATISRFVRGDSLILANIPYTSFTYTQTGASNGTLQVFSGSTLEGSLNLSGVYSQSTFNVQANPLGTSDRDNVIITTAVTNSANGSTSAQPGAVYRFFDTKFGTHFFTSDVGERDTVIATRTDLKEETNGFGDLTTPDANSVTVYRFFDKNFGTHFFTANAGERDTVINTRPDLTYEPTSTFLEHGSQQAGDVAVHRLFDTIHGTQFLTGDQNEYSGLVTAGSSTFRGDLRDEGTAFYAPTGSFT